MRSLNYLLEDKKLQECGLLGKNESTNYWPVPKFVKWESVPRPRRYRLPSETSPILGSSVRAPKRTRSEDEGIMMWMHNMYSPTLLNNQPNQLVSFPRYPDHNFVIWANPDLIVHRFDKGLRSRQIKYSTEEHMEEYLNQYGTNEYKNISHITISIDDFPPAVLVSEPDISSTSRLPLSS